MSWPKESDSYKFIDWSYFNNQGWPRYKPFDVAKFCELHPEVDGAVVRFMWPGGKQDQHFEHYFDGFTEARKMVAGYGWTNPGKSIATNIANAKAALGSRIPRLIGFDYEEVTDWNYSKPQWTNALRNMWDAQRSEWPDSGHMSYGRAGWLDDNISAGDWFHEIDWWLAHWIYPPPDWNRQASHWSEIDLLLPIDNNFTPYRGRVVKIQEERVKGWQISSRGDIVPRGFSDMGYFLKEFIDPFYEQPEPPPDPGSDPGDPVPVEIHFPEGSIDLTVVESDGV